MNLITPEEIVEHEDHNQKIKMALKLAMSYGEVYSLEIPKPDGLTGICTVGTGKVFIKFRSLISAKKFRLDISGKIYNNRIIICSYYPEKYFDTQEFDVI